MNYLLTYFNYPQPIRRSLHSNNIKERINNDLEKKLMEFRT